MTTRSVPYLPGTSPPSQGPLSRYLPPIPQDVASEWLELNFPLDENRLKQSWILDPFAASPHIPVEMARLGYRVLVTANNPIIRHLIELTAHPPTMDELNHAIADIASLRLGDKRLEPYFQSLFATHCLSCGATVIANGFIWERGSEREPTQPILKSYHCSSCHIEGEFPVTQKDIEQLDQFTHEGISQSLALERITDLNDPDRSHVEEAIMVYPPRTLYALVTLINKKEQLLTNSPQASLIDTILLTAFDLTNSLWAYPVSRARPKQLVIPSRFKEANIWVALEESVNQIIANSSHQNQIATTIWPELPPPTGGICIYDGRLKDILKQMTNLKFGAVVSALPRPNQAFWSLCAIWSGWLWGKESALPIKNVLRRRRYDWGWHTRALYAVFSDLGSILDYETPFLGLIGEHEPGFLNAALIAADLSGYKLSGLAIRPESDQAQINWRFTRHSNISEHPIEEDAQQDRSNRQEVSKIQAKLRSDVLGYLAGRGEPATYPYIHAVSLMSFVHTLPVSLEQDDNRRSLPEIFFMSHKNITELPGQINSLIEQSLTEHAGFIRFGGSEKSIEVGQWWMNEPLPINLKLLSPLSDRVENAIENFLNNNPGVNIQDVDRVICKSFPGIYTPSPELIQICLESYGQQKPSNDSSWELRIEDNPDSRQSELTQLAQALSGLAKRLDYTSSGNYPIIWRNIDGDMIYVWYLINSAIFSQIVLSPIYPLEKTYILLPGGRANLVAYKLNHDARQSLAIEKGLGIVKFRQIRKLSESVVLYPELFNEQLYVDTLTYNAPQMRLF
jgi:hypothetical protein